MVNIFGHEVFTGIAPAMFCSGDTYESCRFVNCDLSGAYLNGLTFIDCLFADCQLQQTDFGNTGLQNISFQNCKLNGVHFDKCLDFLFAVNFEHCVLDNAIFHRKKNKKGVFSDCSMRETDLTNCELTDAVFNNCDLYRASFSQTVLKNADFRTSYNFTIDPDDNVVKNARFTVHGLPGLLDKYGIRIGN